MSVHNSEKYLAEAVESILNQTWSDFEFIIINDASADSSRTIIEGYHDPRIKLVENETNLGLTRSLNTGIDMAQGDYIARMDCDDISLPARLQKQVMFMESHPEVGICGTWVKTIGEGGSDIWNYPTDHETIKSRFVFESVLAHPSVMINRELLNRYNLRYDPAWSRAQDYEFWTRCSGFFRLANLNDVLLFYRRHSAQIGKTFQNEQAHYANLVRKRLVEQLAERLGITPDAKSLELHYSLGTWQFEADLNFVVRANEWLSMLQDANTKCGLFPQEAFSRVLGERWFAVCNAASSLGINVWKAFWASPLSEWAGLGGKRKAKFLLKVLAGI